MGHFEFTYIAIDDNLADLDWIVKEASKTRQLRCLGRYTSAQEAMASMQGKPHPDIIFCDIRLRDEDGLGAGPSLARFCKLLVFVTGLVGQKGLVLDALGDEHLQKPVTCDQIRMRVLDRFFRRYGDEIPMYVKFDRLYVLHRGDKKYHAVDIAEILSLTYSQNYVEVTVRTNDKQPIADTVRYTVRATLAYAFSLIEPTGLFIFVNKSAVINMLHHGKWSGNDVEVNGEVFRLLGEGKKSFMDYIKRYGLGDGGNDGGT